jgi:type II secretory pathway pseudopilin PulG
MTPATPKPRLRTPARVVGFSFPDLLVVVAVLSLLAAVVLPLMARSRSKSQLAQCIENLKQVNHAVLLYANDQQGRLPSLPNSPAPGGWWYYKEQVKSYLGLSGPPSSQDKVFGCPSDRGYGDGTERSQPFRLSKKHLYTSYVFNGVDLPGLPNVAGREVSTIKSPATTLLTMEWTAHAPLSWHRSRTGRANTPFYNNAESVVGFVDGSAALLHIYFDGCNAAYTRDPIPGYAYKYSAD